MENNPLLVYKNDTPDSFIRFDLIKDEHFEPAFEVALVTAKENLKKIIENPDTPTFENTIEALEYVSEDLDRVAGILFNLKESDTTLLRNELAQKIAPLLADFANDIAFNTKLFERIKSIHDAPSEFLNKESQRLVRKTYESMVRNGALLSDDAKEQIRTLDQKVTVLSQKFGDNLLSATNDYCLHINNVSDLSGLPERVIESAKDEAKKRQKEGWVFTLKAPSVGPFMQYADSAELRKEISLAMSSRGMKDPFRNKDIVLEIVRLRKKTAELLGLKSYADFILQNRMAKTSEHVWDFLIALGKEARPYAEKDFEMLRTYKEKITQDYELFPWDVAYIQEKLKKELFNFDEELMRPYFEIERVLYGLFLHAEKLYEISFSPRLDIPTYHESVKVFEASRRGSSLGLLYLDLFPRESKRGGAWADMLRAEHMKNNTTIPAHVFICTNFTKPTTAAPALLSFSEVQTLFHEFGHALHCLLSECQYSSLSGYNVLWDFCELPSQLMESWTLSYESLSLFAQHYKTKEKLPLEMFENLMKADQFMAGWIILAQVGASVLDMAWFGEDADKVFDIEKFEEEILRPYRLFTKTWAGTSTSTSFKHIFNGGYSAGYYSYHWSEVLAADAFEYFKENGLSSKEIAEKFRTHVLSKGNTEEPLELYRAFRGGDADPRALLRHKGLL